MISVVQMLNDIGIGAFTVFNYISNLKSILISTFQLTSLSSISHKCDDVFIEFENSCCSSDEINTCPWNSLVQSLKSSPNSFLDCISNHINSKISSNTESSQPVNGLSSNIRQFSSMKAQNFTITEYLQWITTNAQIPHSIFIIVLIYLQRIQDNSQISLNVLNIYRIVLIALVIAMKNSEDRFISNAYFSHIGGLPSVNELNSLELHFLQLIHFNTYVSTQDFHEVCQTIHVQISDICV
mmetsp:Transcript_9403/g.16963  ORF Transcript_9403/g.16963 Transcript_9403/m.16963 type:complete len:240 (-) Transcript_9403:37-756(-)